MSASTTLCGLAFFSVILPLTLFARAASAEEPTDVTRDAAGHFQRGVALYGEADYRAALVEFKRAYSVSPNVAVLYNIGETQYQLQDYAGALTTFTGFLAESGPNETHRSEVQSTIEVLRTRVGHMIVATDPPGAEVAIDDQTIGKTPFEDRILVSIGRRKVTASMAGRSAVTRFIDVAAADNVAVKLSLPATPSEVPPELSTLPPAATTVPSKTGSGTTLRIVGWSATGVLAVGAGVSGVLALEEASQLSKSRNSYPTTEAVLKNESRLTSTYSILADSLTAAAIAVGGITLFSTVSAAVHQHSHEGAARVWVGPASAHFEMTF
ncbi:MAG TPA: PEGA domain-containing protein [Polyangiaceae bacterium]|nr:PEGA domain-containing protein [Polyangiaceae bacterium]